MQNRKLLLFTFDYELFLGNRTGTVHQCLIHPTEILLAKLNAFAFKGVFFVDTVYLLRLQEMAAQYPPARTDLDAITGQLVQLVQSGHEIHPHLHPHWMDAVYHPEINEWSLEEKRYYTLAAYPELQRTTLIDHAFRLIRSVLEKANSSQPVDAYRAGGWSIQPFEHFRPWFLQYGIKQEWSIIPGKFQFTDAHFFDFREAPTDEPVYRFSEDPCRKDDQGPFTEWTISAITLNRFEKWVDFKISSLLQRLGKRPSLKGHGVSSVIREQGDRYCPENQKRIVASFEGLNPFTMRKYLSAIKRNSYFQFISHPKLISPFEFTMMERLFGTLKKNYAIETDFRKALPE